MTTASGATAAQIVHSSRKGSRVIEYMGSACTDAEVEALKAAARQRLAARRDELDPGLPLPPPGGPLPITASWMRHLWGSLAAAFALLRFAA